MRKVRGQAVHGLWREVPQRENRTEGCETAFEGWGGGGGLVSGVSRRKIKTDDGRQR